MKILCLAETRTDLTGSGAAGVAIDISTNSSVEATSALPAADPGNWRF
jgi:hypothetical protein